MLFSMATMWYVLEKTNSPMSTAVVVVIPMLTALVVFQPFATIADRLHKKVVLVGSDVFRAAVVLLVALLMTVHRVDTVGIYVATFFLTLAGYLFGPAQNAALPRVLPNSEKLLPIANSLLSATSGIISLLGYAIGGIIVAILYPVGAVVADGCSFLISALSILVLPIPALRAKGRKGVWGFVKDSFAGLQFIWNRPAIRMFGLFVLLINFVSGPAGVLTVVFSRSVLHAGLQGYGYLEAAYAVGGVVGSVVSAWASRRLRLWQLSFIALVGSGLSLASMPIAASLIESIIALTLASIVITMLNIPLFTALQLLSPEELRGRVMASFGLFAGIGQPLGLLIGSWLMGAIAPSPVFLASGILLAMCGILSFFSRTLRGRQNQLESQSEVQI